MGSDDTLSVCTERALNATSALAPLTIGLGCLSAESGTDVVTDDRTVLELEARVGSTKSGFEASPGTKDGKELYWAA